MSAAGSGAPLPSDPIWKQIILWALGALGAGGALSQLLTRRQLARKTDAEAKLLEGQAAEPAWTRSLAMMERQDRRIEALERTRDEYEASLRDYETRLRFAEDEIARLRRRLIALGETEVGVESSARSDDRPKTTIA